MRKRELTEENGKIIKFDTRIILSEAVQFGIKGTTRRKPKAGKKYPELVREADKQIDEDRFRFAHAYKKSSTYLAG